MTNVKFPIYVSEGIQDFTGKQTPTYFGPITVNLSQTDADVAVSCASVNASAAPASINADTGTITFSAAVLNKRGCSFTNLTVKE